MIFLSAYRELWANAAPLYTCCSVQQRQNHGSTAALGCRHFEAVCQGAAGLGAPEGQGTAGGSPGQVGQGRAIPDF